MSTPSLPEHDERTIAVQQAGQSMAYAFLSFALLANVAYRGLVLHEAAWDLLALVIAAGFICFFYEARQKALPPAWMSKVAAITLAAAFAGIIAVLAIASLT